MKINSLTLTMLLLAAPVFGQTTITARPLSELDRNTLGEQELPGGVRVGAGEVATGWDYDICFAKPLNPKAPLGALIHYVSRQENIAFICDPGPVCADEPTKWRVVEYHMVTWDDLVDTDPNDGIDNGIDPADYEPGEQICVDGIIDRILDIQSGGRKGQGGDFVNLIPAGVGCWSAYQCEMTFVSSNHPNWRDITLKLLQYTQSAQRPGENEPHIDTPSMVSPRSAVSSFWLAGVSDSDGDGIDDAPPPNTIFPPLPLGDLVDSGDNGVGGPHVGRPDSEPNPINAEPMDPITHFGLIIWDFCDPDSQHNYLVFQGEGHPLTDLTGLMDIITDTIDMIVNYFNF